MVESSVRSAEKREGGLAHGVVAGGWTEMGRWAGQGSLTQRDKKGFLQTQKRKEHKSQVLPGWELLERFLAQKRNSKKTGYWLTSRKSWTHWGWGGGGILMR